MSRLSSASPTLSNNRFVASRSSGPRLRAELKPLGSLRLFARPAPALVGLWSPERLARLHEPLSRYHD